MIEVVTTVNKQWLVVGDFNNIACMSEKKIGGVMDFRACIKFKEWINACRLTDLGYVGKFKECIESNWKKDEPLNTELRNLTKGLKEWNRDFFEHVDRYKHDNGEWMEKEEVIALHAINFFKRLYKEDEVCLHSLNISHPYPPMAKEIRSSMDLPPSREEIKNAFVWDRLKPWGGWVPSEFL
ncbi:hypothetical protein AHAS_Ahas13G0376400 [Arachis hypogaea]